MYLPGDHSSAPSEYFLGPIIFLPGLFVSFSEIYNTLSIGGGGSKNALGFLVIVGFVSFTLLLSP